MASWLALLSVVLIGVAACAPASPAGRVSSERTDASAASPRSPKGITIGMDEDIKNLWDSITLGGGSGAREIANIVNAHLVVITSDGSPRPRLLTELPS